MLCQLVLVESGLPDSYSMANPSFLMNEAVLSDLKVLLEAMTGQRFSLPLPLFHHQATSDKADGLR